LPAEQTTMTPAFAAFVEALAGLVGAAERRAERHVDHVHAVWRPPTRWRRPSRRRSPRNRRRERVQVGLRRYAGPTNHECDEMVVALYGPGRSSRCPKRRTQPPSRPRASRARCNRAGSNPDAEPAGTPGQWDPHCSCRRRGRFRLSPSALPDRTGRVRGRCLGGMRPPCTPPACPVRQSRRACSRYRYR